MSVGHDLFMGQDDRGRIALRSPQIGLAELLQQSGALWIDRTASRGSLRRIAVPWFIGLGAALPTTPSAAAPRHALEDLRLVKQRKVARVGLDVEQAAERDLALHTAGEQ